MLGYACHGTVILRVVGRLMNPTHGCKEIMWSDTCLVLLVILLLLFVCTCALAPTVNLTADASTWLKNEVASNCHHHVVAEPLIAAITVRTFTSERGRIAFCSCRGNRHVACGEVAIALHLVLPCLLVPSSQSEAQ